MESAFNKQSSKNLLYYRIAELGIVSKADLLSYFKMTTSTMNRLLDELLADQLIMESGLGPSNGGRKPILFQINPGYGYFFGLEISRFHSALGLFDMNMNPMSFTRWRMDEDMTPEVFVALVAKNIRSFLKDHRLEQQQILGIGIGAVGPLDRGKGLILKPLYFPAKGWTNVAICELLTNETGISAYLDNGANTALLGEHWSIRQSQSQHMLYVHAGVSLRSSMMSFGKIVHGKVDMEGSIGQMIIQTDGPRLSEQGNYGALEAFVSVNALERQARMEAKLDRADIVKHYHVDPEHIKYEMLLRELRMDNAYVLELFHRSARYFGVGLANLINMFHPDKIILGGALINSDERFYNTAVETAQKNTYYYPEYEPQFSKGELKEDAVATGAALMVWKSLDII
ncbi:ROK family protein [Paenibacillus sp. FJAT-27812]|uniref:ROK family protein n=1 Tax=Paenibacillus sp. FJAT-27812 TaxID=1684143 RepID=UPI0006A7C60A|nr:ROK family protein [Paenibacillus sp. FJAT-27812]